MITRAQMDDSLKKMCVPHLRDKGFKGSFPNFYRDTNGFVALVNFQYFAAGGSFCVNLGYADPERKNVSFKPETPINKLRVSQTRDRIRLGSQNGDRWFSFGETSYDEYRGDPQPPEQIADTINQLFDSHAEAWWKTNSETFSTDK